MGSTTQAIEEIELYVFNKTEPGLNKEVLDQIVANSRQPERVWMLCEEAGLPHRVKPVACIDRLRRDGGRLLGHIHFSTAEFTVADYRRIGLEIAYHPVSGFHLVNVNFAA